MIISVPVQTDLVSTTVTDSTETFSTTVQKTWTEGDEVQFSNQIFIATEDISVLTYDPTLSYNLGDVIWGEGTANQVVTATSGDLAK